MLNLITMTDGFFTSPSALLDTRHECMTRAMEYRARDVLVEIGYGKMNSHSLGRMWMEKLKIMPTIY